MAILSKLKVRVDYVNSSFHPDGVLLGLTLIDSRGEWRAKFEITQDEYERWRPLVGQTLQGARLGAPAITGNLTVEHQLTEADLIKVKEAWRVRFAGTNPIRDNVIQLLRAEVATTKQQVFEREEKLVRLQRARDLDHGTITRLRDNVQQLLKEVRRPNAPCDLHVQERNAALAARNAAEGEVVTLTEQIRGLKQENALLRTTLAEARKALS